MLMLLKPWRELKTDLKKNNETWEHAFESFTATCSKRELDIMSDIQYFYECESSAHRKQAEQIDEESFAQLRRENGDVDDGHDAEEDIPNVQYSEAGLVALIASQKPEREIRHGLHAVAIARSAKVFDGSSQSWALSDNIATTGTSENIVKLQSWKEQMSGFVRSQNEVVLPTAQGGHGSVSKLTEYANPGHNNQQLPDVASMDRGEEVEAALEQLDPTELKEDQRRADDIITWHLEQTLAGHNPPPLRMVLYGEGGTGKSCVIQTVTQYFEQHQAKHWLLKGAYTGVAASLIDGKTLHVIGNISVNRAGATTMSEESGKNDI
ncbi:Vacuolar membrane-associated protein IML1 [Debaryomyces hansenii CBS767] [Lentinula edodes]|uniref:ATP-dependent DNA helicase n=1 Tax=Lentinula edodes TaxID=5353 RepID=A0A1Q3E4C4_LENED|nr:Vacuolar membrane-associated protein IML1 [Debaryomyces hansenii CBS767] [Lentinula edodes]